MSEALQGAAGAIGAMGALAITYPLYSLSIRMQAGGVETSAAEELRQVLRKDGLATLMRGVNSALLANGLQSFAYYFWFAWFKKLHGAAGRHSPLWTLLTAGEAGVACVLITNPFWAINTRQITAASGSGIRHLTALETAAALYAEGGLASFYTGLVPALVLVSVRLKTILCPAISYHRTLSGQLMRLRRNRLRRVHQFVSLLFQLISVFPLHIFLTTFLIVLKNPMAQFYSYELSLRIMSSLITGNTSGRVPRVLLTPLSNFCLGAWAKICATVVTYPVQTIRTALSGTLDDDGSTHDRKKKKYHGEEPTVLKCAAGIVKKSGFLALFRGIEAKLLQTSLNAAILMLIRIRVLRVLRRY